MALFRVMECVVAFSSMVSTMTLAITYHWWMNLKMFRVLSIEFIACRRLIISMEFNVFFILSFYIYHPMLGISQFSFSHMQFYLQGIMIFVHNLLINYSVNWAYQNHLMNSKKRNGIMQRLITNHESFVTSSHNFFSSFFNGNLMMVIKTTRFVKKKLSMELKATSDSISVWNLKLLDWLLFIIVFLLFTGIDNFNCFNCLTKWKVVIAHWLFAYLYFKRIHKSHADKLIASDKKAMKDWIFFTHFHNNRKRFVHLCIRAMPIIFIRCDCWNLVFHDRRRRKRRRKAIASFNSVFII